MPSTWRVGESWSWFKPVTTSFGPFHWSTRHQRLVALHEGEALPQRSYSFPGPEVIVDGGRHFHAWAAVFGVCASDFDVADLDVDVRGAIARHFWACEHFVAREGWAFPTLRDVWLTVDGRVVVDVVRGAAADFGPKGHPDSAARDAHNDARDAALDHARDALHAFAAALDVDVDREAVAGYDANVADFVAEVAAGIVADFRAVEAAHADLDDDGRAPPEPWTDERRRDEQFGRRRDEEREREAPGMIGHAVAEGVELQASVRALVDVPAGRRLRARAALLRELPLTLWTDNDLARWRGLLEQRRRAVVVARGLVALHPAMPAERAATFSLLGEGGVRELSVPDPTGLRALDDAFAGLAVDDDALAADVDVLRAHGLFAVLAHVEILLEGQGVAVAQRRWRDQFIAFDNELGDARRAALSTTPPTLTTSRQALAAAEQQRLSEPQTPWTTPTAPAAARRARPAR